MTLTKNQCAICQLQQRERETEVTRLHLTSQWQDQSQTSQSYDFWWSKPAAQTTEERILPFGWCIPSKESTHLTFSQQKIKIWPFYSQNKCHKETFTWHWVQIDEMD